MKKYETGGWQGVGLIREVEVVRETDHCVYILDSRGKEFRQFKESQHGHIHDSWEDAHRFLITKQQEKVDSLRKQLERENGKLGQIKGIKKPEAA